MGFDTVLVANRGEIALRIIKACRSLDLKSVAVFSDADKSAPFVAAADKAVSIGPSDAVSSYLNMAKIVEAAKTAGAGAIHPGYGFLAENAEFARMCAENELVFIGPSANLIEKMGSKIAAKSMAVAAGVPVVPGYHSADQRMETLVQAAKDVGV
ncbi:MAG: acetyl/propionyl-CoA carboxylase subunit alpha, partial [Sneathiella sp.]|nr:acetyl/propionyl-CoA carboxylase subunit alpha [Sneathiella sp.]